MQNSNEVRLPTPQIVLEAAQSIKTAGEFKKGLTGMEVSGLVKGIVSELVTSNPQVKGSIPFMDVKINQGRADIKGTIRIESPIGATVGVAMVLKNASSGKNAIELGMLKIDPKADGFVGRIALGALNLEEKAKAALSNPTDALNVYLTKEMRKQNVKLEGIAMKFTADNKFTILLRGSSITSSQVGR